MDTFPDSRFDAPPLTNTLPHSLHYAGFWRRLGAMLIDFLVIAPLMAAQVWLADQRRLFRLYFVLPWALLLFAYNVGLVARYGGTPGKLVLGLRIALVDGSKVTLRAAVLRHSVQFVLTLISMFGIALGVLAFTDAQWHAIGFREQGRQLRVHAPSWYGPVQALNFVWMWSELVVLLTNRRRRALHDFIAGTVVLYGNGADDQRNAGES